MMKYRLWLSGVIYMGLNDDIWFLKEVIFIFVLFCIVDDYKIQINIVYFVNGCEKKIDEQLQNVRVCSLCVFYLYQYG